MRLLLLAALTCACTARHLVVPDHASSRDAADYGGASLQVRNFLVDGLGDKDDPATGPAALRSAFAEYVTARCRFRDVRFGKQSPEARSIAVDVNVAADHTKQRTWILDYVGLTLWWPVVPQWGSAHVSVSVAADDASSRWTAEGSADVPYSMILYSWWRTTPVEDAYRSAYAQAFQKAANAFCADDHTVRVATGAAPPRPVPQVQVAQMAQRVAVPAAAVTGKVAVLDFRNFTSDLHKENVQYFTDLVRGVVLKSAPRFNVITRENLLVLLQASGKDAGACEGECEVDTGRRIGADLIVSGDIQKVGTRFKISLRMHETKEGRLVSTAIASGGSIDALDDASTKAADELVAPIR